MPPRLIRCIHPMLELTPGDPIIKTYLKDLQHLKDQDVVHELGLKGPFQNLLDKAAKRRGWTRDGENCQDSSRVSPLNSGRPGIRFTPRESRSRVLFPMP